MTMKKALLSTTAILMASTMAQAQTIDYGGLEMMFGEPVTEGATGTPKRASDTPINMTIVTAEEIERSGARDIPEILRRVAGVDVQRMGQFGASVSIRGRNHDGQRLRVLINGRDTFRAYEGTTVWNSLPVSMEEIRQIEVVRGPATALYGANAVTGVVNIITFSPLYDRPNTVTAKYGDNGLREVSAVSTLGLGDAGGIRLSGGYTEMDIAGATLTASQILAREEEPDMVRFSGDGLFNLSSSLKVGFEGTYFKGDTLAQSQFGIADAGTSEDYSLRLYAALDSSIGRWTFQAFQNVNDESRNNVLNLSSGNSVVYTQSIAAKTKYVDLSNAQSLGATNVRFTVGYREDAVDQFGNTAALGTGQVGYKTFFVSGLADHTFSDTLSLAVSARYDSLDAFRTADELPLVVPFTNDDFGTYNEISVNAGLTYKMSDVDTLKVMYARGFQAPNLFQLGGESVATSVFPGTVGIGGSPLVESAISTQYELQYLRSLADINGSLSVSVFYRKDADGIARSIQGSLLPLDNGTLYLGSDNIGNAETLGFEVDLKGKTEGNVVWGLNYAFADTSDELTRESGFTAISDVFPIKADYFADRSSKHIATANLGYEAGKFSADALIQYKSGYTSYSGFTLIPGVIDPTHDVDGVWIGNLAAHYQLTDNVKLSVVGEGLFEKIREDAIDASLAAERRIRASVSFSF
ncbi:TonB-dependent receptor plug domain-containing protein [Kordiimonas sp.]|uniref:TonB-dependent receptor plug domain-containing protein n=1 Tax=Kordiimonas sp. TaxID=1970157 RepID=UPI003A8EC212